MELPEKNEILNSGSYTKVISLVRSGTIHEVVMFCAFSGLIISRGHDPLERWRKCTKLADAKYIKVSILRVVGLRALSVVEMHVIRQY